MDLNDFARRVALMPHVTEILLHHLDIVDIVNCLKTSKPLRHLIAQCSLDSTRFRKGLNLKTVRYFCGKGSWKQVVSAVPLHGASFHGQAFGLGDWICNLGNEVQMHNIWSRRHSCLAQPHGLKCYKVAFISGDGFLVSTADKVNVVNLEHEDSVSCRSEEGNWNMQTTHYFSAVKSPISIDGGAIYDTMTLDSDNITSMFFFDKFGQPMLDAALLLSPEESQPIKVVKQGQIALLVYKQALAMYNASTGIKMWRTELEKKIQFTDKEALAFVTEVFCGYVYMQVENGVLNIRVVIYLSRSGQFILDSSCWKGSGTVFRVFPVGQESISVEGNFLCITNYRSSVFFAKVCRSPEERCTAKCGHIHLKDWLAHDWMAKQSESDAGSGSSDRERVGVALKKVQPLGFAAHGMALISSHAYFTSRQRHPRMVVAVMVDLGLAADLLEPCRTFAAVRMPLALKHRKCFKMLYPYFRTYGQTESEVGLAGVVVMDKSKLPIEASIYSFPNELGIANLEGSESALTDRRKRTKKDCKDSCASKIYLRKRQKCLK